jgi:hypothetical protein
MNLKDKKYKDFALVKEMLETPEIMRRFQYNQAPEAIAMQDTIFPTIRLPHVWGFDTFLQLLAGWNILVHVGVALGINLDKPTRARKVGNEFIG